MQKRDGGMLYSASDLVNYLECEHLTTLDLVDLHTPLPRTNDSDEAKLIQAKGFAHEAEFLAALRQKHERVIDIGQGHVTMAEKFEATVQAMRDGYNIIFQATLQDGCFIGYADFLRKVHRPSLLGEWSYEVLDTKLSRSQKAKFIVQLAYYSGMVAKVQGVSPLLMHVVLGDKTEVAYRYADYARYLSTVTERFLARVSSGPAETYPVPCEKCDQCKWKAVMKIRRLRDIQQHEQEKQAQEIQEAQRQEQVAQALQDELNSRFNEVTLYYGWMPQAGWPHDLTTILMHVRQNIGRGEEFYGLQSRRVLESAWQAREDKKTLVQWLKSERVRTVREVDLHLRLLDIAWMLDEKTSPRVHGH